MIAATFIFKKKQFDEEFHRLDNEIATFAKSLPGYIGETSWENTEKGQTLNTYYWADEAALSALMNHPPHQSAKSAQSKWLDGYQVIIQQVLHTYGDSQLDHPLAGVTISRP